MRKVGGIGIDMQSLVFRNSMYHKQTHEIHVLYFAKKL